MTNEKLEGIANSHEIKCRGMKDKKGTPYLPPEKAETVIIKVYKNGSTKPVCRYFFLNDCVCNAKLKNMDKLPLDNYLTCPYVSERSIMPIDNRDLK